MPSEYFMTSARLGFRCWRTGDFPLAMALWGDPEVTRFIGGPFTEQMVRARLEQEISQQQQHGLQYWPVFLLASAQHVGCVGLRPYRSNLRILELGFHLRRAFWNQGLATEAARACIAYAFRALGVEALSAGHHPENKVSRRLLLKLGFTRTQDESYPPTGLMHPSYFLGKK